MLGPPVLRVASGEARAQRSRQRLALLEAALPGQGHEVFHTGQIHGEPPITNFNCIIYHEEQFYNVGNVWYHAVKR